MGSFPSLADVDACFCQSCPFLFFLANVCIGTPYLRYCRDFLCIIRALVSAKQLHMYTWSSLKQYSSSQPCVLNLGHVAIISVDRIGIAHRNMLLTAYVNPDSLIANRSLPENKSECSRVGKSTTGCIDKYQEYYRQCWPMPLSKQRSFF